VANIKITARLFGSLRLHLPDGSEFNSCEVELEEADTLAQLLSKLQLPHGEDFIILINDQKIHQGEYETTVLNQSDEVVLLPPIKGG
jgi:thiamine biosynthesis protein ThiS